MKSWLNNIVLILKLVVKEDTVTEMPNVQLCNKKIMYHYKKSFLEQVEVCSQIEICTNNTNKVKLIHLYIIKQNGCQALSTVLTLG